ncbi:MAG: dTDP-4-dehydrorhamnose 3,5-epimerase [Planctomycetaceae bacterium]|nr:dTDP-4-dehydrorhamnose 3,5-epimerase [Planctomycetaceae bacterium]
MKVEETSLPGVVIVELDKFEDERGFFVETYQQQRYSEHGIEAQFVQDNYSRSTRGILRGLHYQIQQPQGKLIQVVSGEIYDVAVDMRRSSQHFGRWFGIRLNSDSPRQLYIPPGFAHGFCVLSEVADFFYKCTDLYAREHERTLLWNDPTLGIDWPITENLILSEKDQAGKLLVDADCYK